MQCVLATELAVLVKLDSVRIVFLVFHCVVVSLLAFAACECDSNAHFRDRSPVLKTEARQNKAVFTKENAVLFFFVGIV